jgi:hypothetical protein
VRASQGKCLSIGPDRGYYPLVKSEPGGFTHLSQVILAENPDGSMPAHMKGREGNLTIGTQMRSLRVLGPLNGAPDAPVDGHSLCCFIPRSGCSGGSDLTNEFDL